MYFNIRRFIAFVIDWCVYIGVGNLLTVMGPGFNPEYLTRPSIKMFSSYGVILAILWFIAIPLFRDLIFGCSIGKIICGLRIVNAEGKKASASQRLSRNLTMYIFQAEIFVCLFNKGNRLGDMMAKTKVVARGKENE